MDSKENALKGWSVSALRDEIDRLRIEKELEEAALIKKKLIDCYAHLTPKYIQNINPNWCFIQLDAPPYAANVMHMKENGFKVWKVDAPSYIVHLVTWNDANVNDIMLNVFKEKKACIQEL